MGQSDKRRRRAGSSFSHVLEVSGEELTSLASVSQRRSSTGEAAANWSWELSCAEAIMGLDGATSGC